MSEEFRVGDLVTLDSSYRQGIPKRVYQVIKDDYSKDPFRYQLLDTNAKSIGAIIHASGKGYRLLTEVEKLLFIKDGRWTYK